MTYEKVLELLQYYKTEYQLLCSSVRQKNKEIAKLNKEITALKNEIKELKKDEKIESLF